MMMISDEFPVQILGLSKSDIDKHFHQVALNLNRNCWCRIQLKRNDIIDDLGSVFMVVRGNRDMGLLVADTAFTDEENMEIRFSMDMMDDEQSGFEWWRDPN